MSAAKSPSSSSSETFPESGSWTAGTSPSPSLAESGLGFLREPYRSMVQSIDLNSLFLVTKSPVGHVLGMKKVDKSFPAIKLQEMERDAASNRRTVEMISGSDMRGMILGLAQAAGEFIPSPLWLSLTREK